ncbi:MAG: hypothetical protein ABUT39_04055 [Acidobacteriota bacterium]
MKLPSLYRLFLLTLLLGLSAAASVQADGYCSEICSSGSYCETSCLVCGSGSGPDSPDGGCANPEATTCGDMGYSCTPWTCTPNWVTTSSTPIGGFAVQSLIPYGCDYYGVSSITQHDQQGCEADRQLCEITFHTFRSDSFCCSHYWCGGNTCGWP